MMQKSKFFFTSATKCLAMGNLYWVRRVRNEERMATISSFIPHVEQTSRTVELVCLWLKLHHRFRKLLTNWPFNVIVCTFELRSFFLRKTLFLNRNRIITRATTFILDCQSHRKLFEGCVMPTGVVSTIVQSSQFCVDRSKTLIFILWNDVAC